MSEIISSIKLVCQNGSSNKFYNVQLVLENDQLSMRSEYGAIGSSPKNGVGGSFIIDMKAAVDNPSKLTNGVNKLVNEGNALAQTKIKKGYEVVTGQSRMSLQDVMAALDAIYDITSKVEEAQVKASGVEMIDVEVVGMVAGVAKVAKVLADYSYEVLGEVVNPKKKAVRVGDVVKVHDQNGRWILV